MPAAVKQTTHAIIRIVTFVLDMIQPPLNLTTLYQQANAKACLA
jgi:hypothetical protein